MTPGNGNPARAGGSNDDVRDLLRRMPKAELHVHLDGSLRAETLIELGAEYGLPMPAADPETLRAYMHVSDARDLVDYLRRFDITLSVMQTARSLERVAFELARDLAAENVRYAEIRYSPVLHARQGLSLEETVEAPLRGLERASAETGIRTGLIVCAIRSLPPEVSVRLAELAGAFRDRGVVGFDLAGAEREYPASAHAEAFRVARSLELHATVHAGEAAGPESIRQALEDCGAERIGHGTRLFEDDALLRDIRDARIPIEVCLTSNVQTRAVEGFETHPVRRYFEEGLVVTLNTDNRLMSGTTMTEEYWRAYRHLGFPVADLGRTAMMSFESAFTSDSAFREMADDARTEILELTNQQPGDNLVP